MPAKKKVLFEWVGKIDECNNVLGISMSSQKVSLMTFPTENQTFSLPCLLYTHRI